MENKHTPGPWYFTGTDTFSINTWNDEDPIGEITDPNARANAALIAAAPDMYEALNEAARLIGLILAGDEAVDTEDIENTYGIINTALTRVSAPF